MSKAGIAEPADALLKVREARRLYETVLQLIPAGMSLPQARALPRDPNTHLKAWPPTVIPSWCCRCWR